jgi:class 3 adenylate cyclase
VARKIGPGRTSGWSIGARNRRRPKEHVIAKNTDDRRRLLAILAADAAGYSRLMAADDQATVAALDAARAVFREQIESHGGRVVDMAGDSVLAVFDAVANRGACRFVWVCISGT